jgi:hypothetical protein
MQEAAMAVHRKHTLAACVAVVVLVGLGPQAKAREVQIVGPGGEAASKHTAQQVQIWSCSGNLHNCRVSQNGNADRDKYMDREGRIVLPKFKPRKASRAKRRR